MAFQQGPTVTGLGRRRVAWAGAVSRVVVSAYGFECRTARAIDYTAASDTSEFSDGLRPSRLANGQLRPAMLIDPVGPDLAPM
jgi:hypothetical protein